MPLNQTQPPALVAVVSPTVITRVTVLPQPPIIVGPVPQFVTRIRYGYGIMPGFAVPSVLAPSPLLNQSASGPVQQQFQEEPISGQGPDNVTSLSKSPAYDEIW